MAKRIHTNYTKNNYEKDYYRNMVKQLSKEFEDTNENIPSIFEETSKPLKVEELDTEYIGNKVTPKPISTRLSEFLAEHAITLIVSAIIGLAGWNVALQISDAVKKEQLNNLKEDISEITSQIDDLKQTYIRKDIFNLEIEHLEEKITTLKEKLDNIE